MSTRLSPLRRVSLERCELLGWVQGMCLHVWGKKKFKEVSGRKVTPGLVVTCVKKPPGNVKAAVEGIFALAKPILIVVTRQYCFKFLTGNMAAMVME